MVTVKWVWTKNPFKMQDCVAILNNLSWKKKKRIANCHWTVKKDTALLTILWDSEKSRYVLIPHLHQAKAVIEFTLLV